METPLYIIGSLVIVLFIWQIIKDVKKIREIKKNKNL